ncbi:MAG: LysR substrate-binding domain-containing protein [Promethearchaeota archaeon]
MNIETLRNYINLSKYQSFSGLAKDLSISQSTLSHQIIQLEEELGVKLIDRTTRKFKLTIEGKIVLQYAEKIINLYDSCKQELFKYSTTISEDILITTSTIPGEYILPIFITNFNNKYSNVNFQILINNSRESLNLLNKNKADFAGIGSFMNYKKEKFDYIELGSDEMVFICSPKHEIIKKGKNQINFSELVKYPFISREIGSGTRYIIEQQFSKYKLLNSQLEINDNDSIISAVSESNNISILSSFIAKRAEKAGLIKILKIREYPIIAKRDLFFIKLKEKELTGLKKEFWEYLRS